MSGQTAIEWTDRTWNPLTGCTKVSPGCDHCYAKTMHERFNGPGSFDTVTLHPERLAQPLRWRKPARVFVNSMSDLFHRDVPFEFIESVFDVMARTPQHTYQILTKRHARMSRFLQDKYAHTEPLPNAWLGVSVENQQWADIRIPALLDTPAAVRFLSCEPLLGPVSLAQSFRRWSPPLELFRDQAAVGASSVLHWVIVGGESGPGARPMHPEWARSLRDQCLGAGIPFLFKQWGSYDELGRHLSKKLAGRVLDGRTWDEYPVTS
jgi:protein gp37